LSYSKNQLKVLLKIYFFTVLTESCSNIRSSVFKHTLMFKLGNVILWVLSFTTTRHMERQQNRFYHSKQCVVKTFNITKCSNWL